MYKKYALYYSGLFTMLSIMCLVMYFKEGGILILLSLILSLFTSIIMYLISNKKNYGGKIMRKAKAKFEYNESSIIGMAGYFTHEEIMEFTANKYNTLLTTLTTHKRTKDKLLAQQDSLIKKNNILIQEFFDIINKENEVRNNKNRDIYIKALRDLLSKIRSEYAANCYVEICECYKDWFYYTPIELLEVPSMYGIKSSDFEGPENPEYNGLNFILRGIQYTKPKDIANKILLQISKEFDKILKESK